MGTGSTRVSFLIPRPSLSTAAIGPPGLWPPDPSGVQPQEATTGDGGGGERLAGYSPGTGVAAVWLGPALGLASHVVPLPQPLLAVSSLNTLGHPPRSSFPEARPTGQLLRQRERTV